MSLPNRGPLETRRHSWRLFHRNQIAQRLTASTRRPFFFLVGRGLRIRCSAAREDALGPRVPLASDRPPTDREKSVCTFRRLTAGENVRSRGLRACDRRSPCRAPRAAGPDPWSGKAPAFPDIRLERCRANERSRCGVMSRLDGQWLHSWLVLGAKDDRKPRASDVPAGSVDPFDTDTSSHTKVSGKIHGPWEKTHGLSVI